MPKLLRCTVAAVLLALLGQVPASANDASWPDRMHRALQDRKPSLHRVLIFKPKVEMFELQAGGMEKMEDWAAEASGHLVASLQDHLKTRTGLQVEMLIEGSLSHDQESALAETQAMYDAVRQSIILHTYQGSPNNPVNHFFPQKLAEFDYTLGEEVRGLSKDANAYLVIQVLDYRRSKGLIALQTGAMVAGALLGVVPIPRGLPSEASLSLIDSQTGDILWFYRMPSSFDVRDRRGADLFRDEAMRNFPIP